jgi:D-3-phosphoglycerate dehydrogenase / 2-oxoglutarate reductase
MADYIAVVGEGTNNVTPGVHEFRGAKIDVRFAKLDTPEQMAQATADADGVLVALQRWGAEHIAALGPKVRVISRQGIGLDNVDLDAAKARGIAVVCQPNYATIEVATHAVAMLLAVNRRLMEADKIVRTSWADRRKLFNVKPLQNMTVGVIGFGEIGRQAAHRLVNLVAKIVVFDPFVKSVPAGMDLETSLDVVLKRSDAITLHAPLMPETRNMIDARALALMPKGACVVNVSRAELVDYEALIKSIKDGHISGAGLDVFAKEPLPLDDPILAAPNILVSPHVAFASSEAVMRLHTQTAEDLFSYLNDATIVHGKIAVDPRKK